ncbi:hypothetical protein HYU92_04005 [Candidatus Curtissbacteria bacterium]|nr:hypothetical protein [Candidatus Curtissbacteria bacterium]
MLYVLHGEDTNSAYQRLTQILAGFPRHQKIKLTEKNSEEDFYLSVFSQDLISAEKIIICENLISGKKIKTDVFAKITSDQTVIFWEHSQVPASLLVKLKKYASIENFKPQPQIFRFLDSLSNDAKKALEQLSFLGSKETNLIYHLTSRILLLILAKLSFNLEISRKVSGKNIADWQWEKYRLQAQRFNLKTLINLYNGALKIDSLIKTGATNLNGQTLISVLLLKYLSF